MVERIDVLPREVGATMRAREWALETHVAGRQLRPGMEARGSSTSGASSWLRQAARAGTGSGGARSGAQTAAAVGITCLREGDPSPAKVPNRAGQLAALGWSGREAEWIALVALQSGVFTRRTPPTRQGSHHARADAPVALARLHH